jgi:hypothetical protein
MVFDLMEIAGFFLQLSYLLCYVAQAVILLCKKNNAERLKYLFVIAGIYLIVFASMGKLDFLNQELDFSFTQMAIMVFLAYTGTPMMIKKETAAILFVVYAVSSFANFFFSSILGTIAYLIVTWGLIFGAIELSSLKLKETKK